MRSVSHLFHPTPIARPRSSLLLFQPLAESAPREPDEEYSAARGSPPCALRTNNSPHACEFHFAAVPRGEREKEHSFRTITMSKVNTVTIGVTLRSPDGVVSSRYENLAIRPAICTEMREDGACGIYEKRYRSFKVSILRGDMYLPDKNKPGIDVKNTRHKQGIDRLEEVSKRFCLRL